MNISRRLRSCQSGGEEDSAIRAIAGCRILSIDDLGVAKETEFSTALLYEVIQWRYMNRRGGLIVTSNLSFDQLAEKLGDDRVASRLAEICRIISLVGVPDQRIMNGD